MSLAGATALISIALAAAPKPVLSVEYAAPQGCPDAAAFRAKVAARLGYEPAGERVTHAARVMVAPGGSGLTATLELEGGSRAFDAAAGDCEGLISSVALALAIALDSEAYVAPRKPPAAVPAAVPEVEAPPPAPVEEPGRPIHLGLSVAARAALGHLPAAAFGPALEGRLRWGAFSAALELEGAFAAPASALGGRVLTSQLRGGGQACGHIAFVGLCGRLTVGALRVEGQGFENARVGWSPVATVGPYALVVWQPVAGLLLQASAGLDVVLVRNSIEVSDTRVWTASRVAGTVGVAVGWAPL
ncbi:MAG: hypothetical protein JNK82_29220 [Myxococcaceae bacterium]|nr:hypothetical protein [Myxococcaceae bacterium]